MVVLDGAQSYRHEGGNLAVLLCHGFTGSPQSMQPWAHDLAAAGLTVRVPRLPGHGTSWREMARTGWDDWYGVVAAEFADLRRRGHAVVVGGLSMGGALALRIAADHPADVAGLVLVNPAVQLTKTQVRLAPVLAGLHAARGYFAAGAEPREPASAPGVASDIAAPGAHELGYERVPLAALTSMIKGIAILRPDLGRVRAPLVLLRSAVDHVVPASSSTAVLTRVASPDIRLQVLERSFHVATLDHDAPRISEATLELVGRIPG